MPDCQKEKGNGMPVRVAGQQERTMEKMLDIISREVMAAMEASGYDGTYGKVTLSNRPDLCEYQCNGAMAAAD